MRIETLKESLSNMTEPRCTAYGNIRHKLEDIIIIGLCTIMCGGGDFVNMEDFGIERKKWFEGFLELELSITV